MTDPDTALRRALELLAEPPMNPDVSKGYLDLLGTGLVEDAALPKNTGSIQALWASPVGSLLYDNAQAVARRLFTAWQRPIEWLDIPPGGIALDVGAVPVPSPHRWRAPRARVGWPWASTSPSRCWHARSAPKRVHRSASCGRTRNGFLCATRPSMRWSRSPCCS
jgi:hypothetical protein